MRTIKSLYVKMNDNDPEDPDLIKVSICDDDAVILENVYGDGYIYLDKSKVSDLINTLKEITNGKN